MEIDVKNKTDVKTQTRYHIQDYHVQKEVGGVFLGHRDITHPFRYPMDANYMVEVPTGSDANNKWNIKSGWALLKAVLTKVKLRDINWASGNQFGLVGEWHSHPNGSRKLSQQDIITVRERVRDYGSWIVGLIVPIVGGNKCEMIMAMYDKNSFPELNRNYNEQKA